MMPKICYLGRGNLHFVQNWVNHFADRGWQVTLVTGRSAPEGTLLPGVRQFRVPFIPGHQYPFQHGHSFLYHLVPIITYPRSVIYACWLRSILRQLNPDVIHAHNVPRWGVPAALLARFCNKRPLVVTEHGPSHLNTARGLQHILERFAYQHADLVTTLTEDTASILIHQFNLEADRVRCLPWGADLGLFHRGYEREVVSLRNELEIRVDAPVVISLRGMDPFYAIEEIVQAIPSVLEEFPKVVLVLLSGGGSGLYASRVRNLVFNLDLEANVRFVESRVPHRKMPVYLNVAMASLHFPPNDNGSPSISESMACGATVIATDCPGYRERIKHGQTGWLVPRRAEAIAQAILNCLRDPGIQESFLESSKASLFTRENWEHNMDRVEQMYRALIEKKAKHV